MRFTIILLIAGMMQVSAGTYGQQISLNQNGITIRQVFKAIKSQTGYDVLWQPDKLDADKKIDAHFSSASLSQVMRECISGQNLTFQVQDQSIIVKTNPLVEFSSLPQDSVIYKGRITDENGKSMGGATVKIQGSSRQTFSNAQGSFSIYGPRKGTLEVTYIGYQGTQLTLNGLNPNQLIVIRLTPGNNNLGEVNVVSTGYQDIAKERATGSFEVITKEQLQHSSDPNLIKRLEGITTSMDFNNNLVPINSANSGGASLAGQYNNSPLSRLTIRGRNTLNNSTIIQNTSGLVLVVIDGVPSPYSIDNVNPNDVESISVLKDAAAASIWGARAANGVIVVKTKRGSYDRPINISINTNFNITEKVDLFYKKTMSTSDYIDAQAIQFRSANTSIDAATLSKPQPFYSPVAEILGQQKRGEINAVQANAQLDALRGNDVRNDFNKYILRNAFTQSYSLAIDGGSKKVAYRLSGGYDNTLNNTVASGGNRLALTYNTSFKPLKNLELSANINYTQSTTKNQAQESYINATVTSPFFPYTRLADDQGNPLAVPFKYRDAFKNLLTSTYGKNIQDLSYVPLNNINEGYYNTRSRSLNFNLGANYILNPIFSVNVLYNYNQGNNTQDILNRQNSFYMRDLVTYYTTPPSFIDPVTQQAMPFNQQIPLGGLYRPTVNTSSYHSLRGQLNVNKEWNEKHALNAIIGMDASQTYSRSKNFQYYGYNEETLRSNNQLNFSSQVTTLYGDQTFGLTKAMIPYVSSEFTDDRLRTISTYANAAYTYNRKYTLSGSIRRDLSSAFGIGTNKGGTPFYSLGTSWNIANENFYQISFLPRLQLRGTFGYNGNVNSLISARPIITYSPSAGTNGLPTAITGRDATNNELRPERTAITNLGIDFGFKNNRVSGSIEYYNKQTKDLITSNILDPSTGFSSLIYNTADMHGWGTDLTLNSLNLKSGLFSWGSNFLFSYNRVKVVRLFTAGAQTAAQVVGGTPAYNEGYDLSRLFAYSWAGLDHITGNPMGYLNGLPKVLSTTADVAAVTNQPIFTAKYFGSAVPVYYGSFRNTFRYGEFSISANFLYKLGYYFRRPVSDLVRYATLFNTNNLIQGAEYSRRWQRPGDEVYTNVPSMTYPGNSARDVFYQYADINVQKADHVRLQEVNLSYSLSKKNWFLKNPRIYANVSNLGIIWRANKFGLDPDINDYPNPRTYAFGFSANF